MTVELFLPQDELQLGWTQNPGTGGHDADRVILNGAVRRRRAGIDVAGDAAGIGTPRSIEMMTGGLLHCGSA